MYHFALTLWIGDIISPLIRWPFVNPDSKRCTRFNLPKLKKWRFLIDIWNFLDNYFRILEFSKKVEIPEQRRRRKIFNCWLTPVVLVVKLIEIRRVIIFKFHKLHGKENVKINMSQFSSLCFPKVLVPRESQWRLGQLKELHTWFLSFFVQKFYRHLNLSLDKLLFQVWRFLYNARFMIH